MAGKLLVSLLVCGMAAAAAAASKPPLNFTSTSIPIVGEFPGPSRACSKAGENNKRH